MSNLGVFIVMPNHINGIINLINDDNVETRYTLSLQPQTIGQKRLRNQGKNTFPSIIGSYKSAVTKQVHRLKFYI